MPTPSERLQKVIDARKPSEVVFKAVKGAGDTILLSSVITKPSECVELSEDAELQQALSKNVEEHWDGDTGRYYINANVEQLWSTIKHTILREYDEVSGRCAATKRKTEQFIRDIKVTDKYLPNYLIQTFLKVYSKAYSSFTRDERTDLFEQFESLRRTYGKRDR